MAAIKVFYVWQANRSQKCHRRFIRDAARNACKRITLVRSNDFHVTLEEAAAVRPGMCDVPNSTLRKIDECDLLLADLTYVATSAERDRQTRTLRQLSSPAVMLPVGYALHAKGPSRLVGVKNESFGGPDDRLLDVRRRWIVDYSLQPGAVDDRAYLHERNVLSRKLEGVMLTAMHQQQEIGRKLPAERQFLEIRAQFESEVLAGAFPGTDGTSAALAVILAAGEAVDREPKQLASSLTAEGQFDEVQVGGESASGFTAESVIDVTSGGVLRAVSTENLNAHRAGFPLPPGASGMIPANMLERNVILAVHEFCRLLTAVDVPPPWQLGISLLGIDAFTLVVGPGERSDVFDGPKLSADPLIVPDDEIVATPEDVARLLKGTFDCIWREFGLGYSRNYDVEGNWNRRIMA